MNLSRWVLCLLFLTLGSSLQFCSFFTRYCQSQRWNQATAYKCCGRTWQPISRRGRFQELKTFLEEISFFIWARRHPWQFLWQKFHCALFTDQCFLNGFPSVINQCTTQSIERKRISHRKLRKLNNPRVNLEKSKSYCFYWPAAASLWPVSSHLKGLIYPMQLCICIR